MIGVGEEKLKKRGICALESGEMCSGVWGHAKGRGDCQSVSLVLDSLNFLYSGLARRFGIGMEWIGYTPGPFGLLLLLFCHLNFMITVSIF